MSKLSGLITVPFHIGDFLSGTMHMDTLEKGAYIMLILSHYQAGEKGLVNDDKQLSRICGVTPKVWKRIKPILSEKFTVTDAHWKSQKIITVLNKVHENSERQRQRALSRNFPKVDELDSRRDSNMTPDETCKSLKNNDEYTSTAQPRLNHPKPKAQYTSLSNDKDVKGTRKKVSKPDDVDDEIWDDFKQLRKKHRAVISDRVLNIIRKQASDVGMTMNEALDKMVQKNWRGFKAQWITNERKRNESDYNNGHQTIDENGNATSPWFDEVNARREIIKNGDIF